MGRDLRRHESTGSEDTRARKYRRRTEREDHERSHRLGGGALFLMSLGFPRLS
jgi:hypothetical protein